MVVAFIVENYAWRNLSPEPAKKTLPGERPYAERQSAEDAVAQLIIDNERIENKPEEANDINYGKTPYLDSDHEKTYTEDARQANCNRRGNTGSPMEVLNNKTDNPLLCENNNQSTGDPRCIM